MPTYYKPTQYQGKRVIFASLDPDEGKGRNLRVLACFGVLGLGVLVGIWLLI